MPGRLDNIERNLVLEPEWVRESIVVTATGTPTPQAADQRRHQRAGPAGSGSARRPGERAAADAGHVCGAGGPAGRADLAVYSRRRFRRQQDSAGRRRAPAIWAGRFDFGPLSTTAVESAEVYRGPDSNLYGADAASGVVSLTTRTAPPAFPRCSSMATRATSTLRAKSWRWPARTTSWITWAHSVGCRPATICPTTSITWPPRRPTWLAAQREHADSRHAALWRGCNRRSQRLGLLSRRRQRHAEGSGPVLSAPRSTTRPRADFHNSVRYGMTRKREQYHLWAAVRAAAYFDVYGDQPSATWSPSPAPTATRSPGRRMLDYSGTYPQRLSAC